MNSASRPFPHAQVIVAALVVASILLLAIREGLILYFLVVPAAVALVVLLALKPRPVLVLFLVMWAPTLFILKDQDLLTFGTVELNLSRLLGGLILTGLLLRVAVLILVLREKMEVGYASLPLLIFGIYLILCFCWSANPQAGGAELLRFWTGLLFFLVLRSEIARQNDLEVYVRGFLGGITLAAALTIITSRLPESLGPSLIETTEGVVRAAGTTGAAGATGALLFCGLPMFMCPPRRDCLGVGTTSRLLALGIVCVALVATLTRAVLISIPPFLFLWIIWVRAGRISRRRARTLFLLGVVVPTCLALFLQDEAVVGRLSDVPFLGTTLSDLTAGTGRLAVWQANLDAWRAADLTSKLFGLGLHSTSLLTVFGSGRGVEVGPHNTYLWLLVDTGLVGLVIYLTFISIMTAFLIRRLRVLKALNAPGRPHEFVAAFASFFVAYHLFEEMFMSQVVSFSGRAYFLAMLAFATSKTLAQDPRSRTAPVPSSPERATLSLDLLSDAGHGAPPR